MTTLYRIRAVWSYTPGGPGYTNLYFGTTDPLAAGAQTAANDVQAFFNAIKGLLPTTVSVQIDPSVVMVEDYSSEQVGELSLASPPAAIVGTAAGAYSGPSGATVQWNTVSFLYGRRVKGRTYLVPLTSSVYENNGTIATASLTTLRAAADAMVAGGSNLVIYTRQRDAKAADPVKGTPAVTARAGASSPVVSANVRDIAAVLRSRRD